MRNPYPYFKILMAVIVMASMNAELLKGQCPLLRNFMVNACGANEGHDELVNFQTGTTPFSTTSFTVNWPNGGTLGFAVDATTAAYVARLNTVNLSGCPNAFIAAPNPIPPFSKVMVVASRTPTQPTIPYTVNVPCAQGPVYVLFANNTNSAGRFHNGPTCPAGGTRTLTMNWGGSCGATVATYDCDAPGNIAPVDGSTVVYHGPAPTNVSNITPGCNLAPVLTYTVLPVEFLSFEGQWVGNNQVALQWATATESNNKGYWVEASVDGEQYQTLGFVAGAGTSQEIRAYDYTAPALANRTYYRLAQEDFDGAMAFSPVIEVKAPYAVVTLGLVPNPTNNQSRLVIEGASPNSDASVKVWALDGRTLFEQTGQLDEIGDMFSEMVGNQNPGVYIVKVNVDGSELSTKLIRQ